MDDISLFSFMDESPESVLANSKLSQENLYANKRKLSASLSKSQEDYRIPSFKKTKIFLPESDEFETETKTRVVESSELTGASDSGSLLELKYQVRHQVALPPGYNYVPISLHVPPVHPDREYKFELDPFQKVSVYAIQRNESVLVSAHTSAGKTVVAEYAIAQCLNRKQRVIYTSPIKALSNQKYREMLAEFGDVGLMTGDITINPSATCLVMTTEILRSMLYRGSEIIREVSWVIFDEIHYMRDKERGVVWEESIILLPHTVRYVFLSATIPNAKQFAEWICECHNQPCHAVYTDFRPTPLQHYLFPARGSGIYMVVNEKGEFREDMFSKAMSNIQDTMGDSLVDPQNRRQHKGQLKKKEAKNGRSDISKIIELIMRHNHHPVIVFSFSKRECEGLALALTNITFNTKEEEEALTNIFNNAVQSLSEDDQRLSQIANLLFLLRRGVGIHHGGLLPILKEVTEILFQEGLIKVLFATETFSIGLNMPAKTVVFTAHRKFDGQEFRNISSGEYIQMSGRAGRRGLDDRGVVITMFDEKLEPITLKEMVKGEADRLDSAFHLTYNMILNLMRVEGISPQRMLEQCFFQFQSKGVLPQLQDELKREETAYSEIQVPDEALISHYYDLRQQLDVMSADFREVVSHPSYSLPFLQPGRLVKVKHENADFGWGVVMKYQKRLIPNGKLISAIPPNEQYVVDILLNCAQGDPTGDLFLKSPNTLSDIQPCTIGQSGTPKVLPVLLSAIDAISHIRIYLPKDIRSKEARELVWRSVLEVQRRFTEGITLLDPVNNMGITDVKFQNLVKKIELAEKTLFESPVHNNPQLPAIYALFSRKLESRNRIRDLKKRIRSTQDVLQLEELKSRQRVLRRLAFITLSDVVDVKGRVACEISSGDELLLTELIFGGVFNALSPPQCAALLSCFVFSEKACDIYEWERIFSNIFKQSNQSTIIKEEMAVPLRIMQEFARRIAQVCKESKLIIEEDKYVSSFKVELMDAVDKWCCGASFSDICKLTDQFEGSLIRVFRRLGELLRQMAEAANVIGNSELKEKFVKASEMLERPNSPSVG